MRNKRTYLWNLTHYLFCLLTTSLGSKTNKETFIKNEIVGELNGPEFKVETTRTPAVVYFSEKTRKSKVDEEA